MLAVLHWLERLPVTTGSWVSRNFRALKNDFLIRNRRNSGRGEFSEAEGKTRSVGGTPRKKFKGWSWSILAALKFGQPIRVYGLGTLTSSFSLGPWVYFACSLLLLLVKARSNSHF